MVALGRLEIISLGAVEKVDNSSNAN